MWQDFILTGGSIVFIIALIPSVLSKDKPALSTSLITGLTLFVFGVVYATLALWITAILTWIITALWFTLAIQSLLIKNKK